MHYTAGRLPQAHKLPGCAGGKDFPERVAESGLRRQISPSGQATGTIPPSGPSVACCAYWCMRSGAGSVDQRRYRSLEISFRGSAIHLPTSGLYDKYRQVDQRGALQSTVSWFPPGWRICCFSLRWVPDRPISALGEPGGHPIGTVVVITLCRSG